MKTRTTTRAALTMIVLSFVALTFIAFGGRGRAADAITDGLCDGISAAGADCSKGAAKDPDIKPLVQKIVDFLSLVVGAVSVIMIIVGGFRYVISGGDSNATSSAKNTILYAIVGLVIVMFAQIIVWFVYSNLVDSTSKSGGSGKTTSSFGAPVTSYIEQLSIG